MPANVITFAGSSITGDVLYVNSGRGYTRNGRVKPDLTAPAVEVYTAMPSERIQQYGRATGTSMACAIGAGCVALIAEWSLTNQATNSVSARKSPYKRSRQKWHYRAEQKLGIRTD